MSASPLVALAVLLPAAAVPAIYALRARPNLREGATFVAALGLLGVAAATSYRVLGGARPSAEAGAFVFDVSLALRADPFGALFALLAAVLWVATSAFSVGYMRSLREHAQTRYFAAFAASIAATTGVAFAANLLTFVVCYELLTVATYPLVAHAETDEARAAGRTYLAYTFGGGVLAIGGTVLVYALAGTTTFAPGGIAALADADPMLARLAFGLLATGFAVKTAVMPLHGWLPRAMVAPAPVSGLLHAVAVVKSGAFGLGRTVMYVFGPESVAGLGLGTPLAVAAGTTAVLAAVVALRQAKIKRALAYSTVSQLSYIALGFAIDARLAVFGALLHIVAHAFMKITLFLGAGLIYVETGVEYLADLRGIAARLPATTAAFAVGAAGLAGMPLLAGFVSKIYLVLGAFAAGVPWYGAVYLVAGTLKLLLFWPVLSAAFVREGPPVPVPEYRDHAADHEGKPADRAADGGHGAGDETHDRGHGDAEWESRTPFTETRVALLAPVLFTAATAVVLGIVPDALPFWDLAELTVAEVFGP
ncbi:complex I subunit 5 family protein [Halosimplex amylolyticum]|uniref:complex I subunit 5 family protein n=1 Tax=Halosimplex amylolyticum TaxID=3396616 RepID=UPI003F5649B5